jgi:HK97 family phage major capsid protein
MDYLEMKKQRASLASKMEAIQLTAAKENRGLSDSDQRELCSLRFDLVDVDAAIAKHDSISNIHKVFPMGGLVLDPGRGPARHGQKPMSTEYNEAFLAFLRSGGKHATSALSEGFDSLFGGFALPAFPGPSAAAYEGSNSSGGYAVSVPTEQNIVPLGMPDVGVRSIATVIPTQTDIKIPRGTAFPTAAIKLEGDGTGVNIFTNSSSTLDQFLLSAYMVGVSDPVSWELMSDVPTFTQFAITDLLRSVSLLEEAYFVTGTGTGQPQGLVGNVGTGTGAATAVESTGAYLIQSTSDVIGSLKSVYHPTAGWLMNRKTGATIRKAQTQANLFAPIWTRENGRDLLHGYPVTFSQNMPDLPSATTTGVTPMLFGSFSDGYIVGDRGGSGVFVKILDQPKALEGLTVLLCYRRVDGRVRRSEALQSVSISHA